MSNIIIRGTDTAAPVIHVLGGVIRRVSGKWSFIDDAGHKPAGFNPVITEPNSNSIQITYDRTYSKVLTCAVTPDETYTERGIMFGASVGLSKIVIKHSKAGSPTTNSQLEIPSSNIWIYLMMYE